MKFIPEGIFLNLKGKQHRRIKRYPLLVAICHNLKEQGFKKVSLTVDIENEPAIRLYKDKVGFKIVKTSENEYGEGHHRYIMVLDLVDADVLKNLH